MPRSDEEIGKLVFNALETAKAVGLDLMGVTIGDLADRIKRDAEELVDEDDLIIMMYVIIWFAQD